LRKKNGTSWRGGEVAVEWEKAKEAGRSWERTASGGVVIAKRKAERDVGKGQKKPLGGVPWNRLPWTRGEEDRSRKTKKRDVRRVPMAEERHAQSPDIWEALPLAPSSKNLLSKKKKKKKSEKRRTLRKRKVKSLQAFLEERDVKLYTEQKRDTAQRGRERY